MRDDSGTAATIYSSSFQDVDEALEENYRDRLKRCSRSKRRLEQAWIKYYQVRAVVVAQLAERSTSAAEIRGSNPNSGKKLPVSWP